MGKEMGIDENGWERTGSHGMGGGEKVCKPSGNNSLNFEISIIFCVVLCDTLSPLQKE